MTDPTPKHKEETREIGQRFDAGLSGLTAPKCLYCGHLKLNPWRGSCQHEVSPFGTRPVRYCGCSCDFPPAEERLAIKPFIGSATEIATRFIGSGDYIEERRQRCTNAIDNLLTKVLSSRDTEIREVLEVLRGSGGCWCRDGNPLGMLDHDSACLATRALYEKSQPK